MTPEVAALVAELRQKLREATTAPPWRWREDEDRCRQFWIRGAGAVLLDALDAGEKDAWFAGFHAAEARYTLPLDSAIRERDAALALMERLKEALRAWRSAEVHHSAIVLGLREGDKTTAADAVECAARYLRIVADATLADPAVERLPARAVDDPPAKA